MIVPPMSSRPCSTLADRFLSLGVPIFMVHRIEPSGYSSTTTSPDHLRRCLSYLHKRKYNVLSLEDLLHRITQQIRLPEKAVVFTMDDGYTDQAKIAAPIFLEYGYPITFFLITEMVDQQLWAWDAKVSWVIYQSKKNSITLELEDEIINFDITDTHKRTKARQEIRDVIKEIDAEEIPDILNQLAISAEVSWPEQIPKEFQPLDWDTARELEAKGVCFAPHSKTHRILSKIDKASAEDEIIGSWLTLKRELRHPLKVFCYPTGRILDFGPRETDLLQRENFLGAVSTFPGFVQTTPNNNPRAIYQLPRLELPDNMIDFIQYCSWIEQTKHRLRWKSFT